MGFTAYARNSVWDFLLCAAASSALCYSCLIAFLSTLPFQATPWVVVGCCALVTAVLFVVAYNFFTAVIGSIAFVVAVCVSVGVCWSLSPAEALFDDVSNNVYLVVEVVLCSAAVFLLSRKKPLAVVLLVGGLVLCAALEYLYWNGQIASAAVFCVAAACLYALRNYQQSLIGSDSEAISFGSSTLAAAALSSLSVLLAVGVFVLVIAPLGPPSMPLKLVTKHVQLDEEHVVGTGDEMSVLNEELFSWNVYETVSGEGTSEGENDDAGDNEDNEDAGEDPQAVAGSSFNIDDTEEDLGSAVRITVPDWLAIILPLLVVLAIALVITARKLVRRRRYKRICALPARERVEGLYLMFMRAFGKMKIVVPDGQTLREYVNASAGALGRFEGKVDGLAFAELTETYSRAVYGGEEPTDEELGGFDDYYRGFYRNARKLVGPIRYVPLFFRI